MRIVRATFARLVRLDPDEDRRLDELELEIPPALWYGSHVAVPLLFAAAIYTSTGNVGRRNMPEYQPGSQAAAGLLLVLAALPWAAELWRPVRSKIFVPVTLGPIALIGLGRHLGVVDLHNIAADLLPFVVLVVVVPNVIGAPRRVATTTVLSAVGIYLIWNTTTWGYSPGPSWGGATVWFTALVFATAATATYRMIVLAMVEAREAREALVHQQAADERRQVARDIHDVVAHTLAVTMLHITAARMAVRRSAPEEADEALVEAETHGRASLEDVRRIVRLLRADGAAPAMAAQPDLRDVPDLVDCYRVAGLPVELSSTGPDTRERSPVAELAVYRVLQEGLTNATRHGDGPAAVDLRADDRGIGLRVDNPLASGRGRTRRRGSGLSGMHERVAAVGGEITVGPKDGCWVVEVFIPTRSQGRSKPTADSGSSDHAPHAARDGTGDPWGWHPRFGAPKHRAYYAKETATQEVTVAHDPSAAGR